MEGVVLRARTGVTAAAPWPRAEALTTPRLVLEPLRRPRATRFAAHVHPDRATSARCARQPASWRATERAP